MSVSKPFRVAFVICATAALALAAGPAFAHAKLLSEAPVAEDAVSAPVTTGPVTELRLSFSEELNAAFSKVALTDAAGKAIEGVTVTLDAADAKVLLVTFATALPVGEYTVDWTAASSDGHKSTGKYTINVTQ
jgi:methionine-rich copper-binding protein CopC